nr:hypothetical protein Iba_chr04aCG13460 [Ipomoea batatas]
MAAVVGDKVSGRCLLRCRITSRIEEVIGDTDYFRAVLLLPEDKGGGLSGEGIPLILEIEQIFEVEGLGEVERKCAELEINCAPAEHPDALRSKTVYLKQQDWWSDIVM